MISAHRLADITIHRGVDANSAFISSLAALTERIIREARHGRQSCVMLVPPNARTKVLDAFRELGYTVNVTGSLDHYKIEWPTPPQDEQTPTSVFKPAADVRAATSGVREQKKEVRWERLVESVEQQITEAQDKGEYNVVIPYVPVESIERVVDQLLLAGYTARKNAGTITIGWW